MFFVLFFSYFSQFSSFSYLLSLFPSLFIPSSLFFPLFSFLFLVFSSLPFTPTNTVQSTDQQNWRPTSRHVNVIWRTAGAQQSVLSPPPLHSLLPSFSPLLLLKKERELFITGIFPAMNLFLLRFTIDSKKSSPGKITVITVLYYFQNNRPVTVLIFWKTEDSSHSHSLTAENQTGFIEAHPIFHGVHPAVHVQLDDCAVSIVSNCADSLLHPTQRHCQFAQSFSWRSRASKRLNS